MIVNSLDFFIFIYFDLFILLIKQVSFFGPKIFVVVSQSTSKKKKKKKKKKGGQFNEILKISNFKCI